MGSVLKYNASRFERAIFSLLCDPDGHVQIDASGMLMSFEGAPVTQQGDTFLVHMDREVLNDVPLGQYTVSIRITTFERDREVAWTIEHPLIDPPRATSMDTCSSPSNQEHW